MTSIDGGCLGVQYVKDGKIAATVMQFPKLMATRGVELRRRFRQDRKEAERVYRYRCDSYYRQAVPGPALKGYKVRPGELLGLGCSPRVLSTLPFNEIAWVRAPATPQKIVLRSRICLLAREGRSNRQIARELNISRPTVILWREHFAQAGVAGIEHEPPRKPSSRRLDAEQSRRIVETTLHSSPKDATHWSTRSLARHLGLSHMSVARVWDANGLQPHRIKTFKLSRDKHFVEKLTDVVGLYLNPPDKALVFCVDEKSQIQALDRTQPGLPLKRGRCGTMTHDYVRHGTTTLFAALNVLEGTVIGECFNRHRHEEFLKFLRQVDRQTPSGLDLHLIVDNYATHKHPSVTALDRETSSLQSALHPNEFLLAKPRRALVC